MSENETVKTGQNRFSWEALAEHLPGSVGVYRVYSDGRVEREFLNDRFREITGMEQDEWQAFVGEETFHAFYAEDREKLLAQMRQAAETQAEVNLDVRALKQNGEHCWLNARMKTSERQSGYAVLYALFTNVDAEHQARRIAEESLTAIRLASQSGKMAMWLYRTDTHAITQSFAESGSFGYADEIENGPETLVHTGAIHPDDAQAFLEMYRRIDGGALSGECTVRVLDERRSKYEWQHITLTYNAGSAEEAPIAIGFSTNVELQKEAEIRYERENRLRRELVKDAVVYYRINLSTRMVEEMYSEIMDVSQFALPISMDELVARGLFSSCYEADRQLLTTRLNPEHMRRNYERGKSTETFTYRRYLPGKGLRWLKASIAKLKRVSSDDVIAFFTAIDVDDEKKDQILYRDVMNEEIESLITMKVDTKQLRVLKENRPLAGRDEGDTGSFDLTADFRASLFTDMLEEDLPKASQFLNLESMVEALKTKPILQITYRVHADDGAIRRKKVRVFYLDESKQDIVFVRRDITDLYNEQQRQSIAIKRAMDEAKAANEAKSVFLSRMSHDMRTPLNAIIGYSGQTLRDGATETQKDEFLDDIHSSGEYLLGIINDVLDMTKIESNKMVLHLEPYTCAEFKENIDTVIAPLCKKKGVRFVLNFPDNIRIPMMLDKVRFNQIFVNILSNSVKFTAEGGCITLTAVRNELPDGRMDETFTVTDTGCGMSEDFLPHAFDSFSQEYAGQAMHNEQGTGLGLSIVKQLVELMGGTIAVSSKLGEGSTFTVHMVITPAKAGQTEEHKAFPAGGLKGLRLLLCEDHPMNSQIAVRLLEKEGCTIDTASDGEKGVQAFKTSQQHAYDAVLMDIRMPNMNGLEAAKAIRALPREDAQSVPIIAMTANAFVEDRRASLEAGMNAHIAKPIDPPEMYRTIYQLTSTRHLTRTPKVLVVDDIDMNAALVARVLKGQYETIIAHNGAEALDELRKNPYIIAVITDVNMPVMDGGELIRTIRENPAYNRVALIANTEYGNSRMEEEMLRDGADDFIYKPTAPSLIQSRLNNVLAKYR